MKTKILKLIAFTLSLLVFSFTAGAMTATLLTGAIYITVDEVPVTIERSIGVRNANNKSVNVVFEPADDIDDIVFLEKYNITMEPFEERFVKFNISINERKDYDSGIVAIFSKPDVLQNETSDSVGMNMKLVIMQNNQLNESAQDPTQDIVDETDSDSVLLYFAIVILVISAASIMFLKIRRWKK